MITFRVRPFFSGLLILSLLVGCGQSNKEPTTISGESRSVFKWKLVTTWPKNYPGLGSAPENFARIVNEMSGGQLSIKVYGAGEIVPAMEVFSAVSGGTVEMGHSAAYYWKGKIPAAVFFTSVPFGLNAQEMNGWMHYGGGLDLWRDLYQPFNLLPFPGGNTGVQMAGWFNKEINSAEDFKGLKMRLPGLGGEVFTRAGGTAVSMPGSEIYTSMQTGVIDAADWVAPYNDLAFGFQDVAQYYYYPGWQEPGPQLEFIVNTDAFNSLPDNLQAIVEQATRAINQDMLDEYTARNNAALVELRKQGVDIRPLPESVLNVLRKETEAVLSENAENDETFNKIYKAYQDFRNNVSAYHQVSEKAYFDLRD
jgi:TRAP-type mannitol/chloroaromatic compound transport system substrate-binding protein